MRHTRHLALIALAMFLLLVVGAWPAAATITDSPHDLRAASAGGTQLAAEDQICRACHVPHNAAGTDPLWNHDFSAATGFTLYQGLDLEAAQSEPTGTALMCLSCHDGSVAVDQYGGITPVPTAMPGYADLSRDLSDDHPIGIDYDAAQGTDGQLNVSSGTLGTGQIVDFLEGGAGGLLQCMTCHDVHNSAEVGGTSLLRDTLVGSELCLRCHDK